MTTETTKVRKQEVTTFDLAEDAIEAVRQMDLVRLNKKKSDQTFVELKTIALKKIALHNNVIGIKGSLTISKAREAISDIYSKNKVSDTKSTKKSK